MSPKGLAARLLVAIMAVVAVAIAATWIVAALIGPRLFHDHLAMTGSTDPGLTEHAEAAFSSSLTTALAVALLGALAASVVASLFITRRIARSLRPISEASRAIAAGEHFARVTPSGLGSEVDDLALAFNAMADELEQVESTRTQMLGDLAHEMRTPVATLDAYLEAIADGVETADPATLAMLRGQTARLARLAEDMALVSAAEEGRMSMRLQAQRVADVVGRAGENAAARAASAGIELRVRLDTDASILADPERLDQVFTNLINNSLEHTPSGGNITLSATNDNGWAVFTVADDGEGIAPEHLTRVFHRFYRVDAARDREHGGSGIGLSIVTAIVEAHGGSVTAASLGLGKGTTMTVRIPLAQ